jgi:mannan endo-1,4-beta-mannosidase
MRTLKLWTAIATIAVVGGDVAAVAAAPHVQPVDLRATAATVRILNLLAARHPIISGQMLGSLDGYEARANAPFAGVTYGYQHDVAELASQSGKWVGLVGINYGKNVLCNDRNMYVPSQRSPYMECANPRLDYQSAYPPADRILTDYWNAGGLVTVMWQVPNPWTGQSAHDTSIPGKFSDLYSSGTPMNLTYDRMLDELAEPLIELQRAGVVVLFRPFHEQNGNWFWWGNKGPGSQPSADQFSALWRYTFDYLTATKELDNLLWVYCVNRSGGPTGSNDVLAFNPGPRFFDIVAIDDYKSTSALAPQNIQAAYDQIKALGKPIALGEYGPLANYIEDPAHHFDWLDLINVNAAYPGFAYFMAWTGTPTVPQAIIQDENGAALLERPGIVTNRNDRDQKPVSLRSTVSTDSARTKIP